LISGHLKQSSEQTKKKHSLIFLQIFFKSFLFAIRRVRSRVAGFVVVVVVGRLAVSSRGFGSNPFIVVASAVALAFGVERGSPRRDAPSVTLVVLRIFRRIRA
jgi:hypothetical protein